MESAPADGRVGDTIEDDFVRDTSNGPNHIGIVPASSDVQHAVNELVPANGIVIYSANSSELVPVPKEKVTIDWIADQQFQLDMDTWKNLHVGLQLKPVANEFFIKFLNHRLDGIPCVLNKDGGYIVGGKFFVMTFKCAHKTCKRFYKIEQIGDNKFQVYNNHTNIVHVKKVARQMRVTQRKLVSKVMVNMMPSEYRRFAEKGMCKDLRRQGNLQSSPSRAVLNKVRTKTLSSLDYDQDEVYDILKMKISADSKHILSKENDVYIRRFYLDPYMVIAFTNANFQCLLQLMEKFGKLIMFLDATGSIARHYGKKLFYYAGVIAAKIDKSDEKEVARLSAALEFLSGEHDAFNISIALSLYKNSFHQMFPDKEWPIGHCVTDFSFALLNAVCHAWNGMQLISYINYTYLLANGHNSLADLKTAGICTFLQLCIGHLSKTHSMDVSKYFPNMNSNNAAVLKEVFSGMFDVKDLASLRKIWKDLSRILLSKYVSEEVQNSLRSLAKIMTKKNCNGSEEEVTEDKDSDDDKLPVDVHEFESMFEKSLFYQNFNALTYAPEFDKATKGPVNAFYCPEYADVFLKKYLSLVNLWTCLTQNERSANSCAECHFKNSKQLLIREARSIGSMPLKPGRFLRVMESCSNSTSSGILDELPQDGCCYQNDRKSRKRKVEDDEIVRPPKKKSLMDLYKIHPNTKNKFSEVTPGKLTDEVTKDKVENFLKIDDMTSREQWNRKRKNKFSYIRKINLRKINKNGNQEELKKILEKENGTKQKVSGTKKQVRGTKKKVSGSTARTLEMKNRLIDNPATYFAPKVNFVVSSVGNRLLSNLDYNQLQEKSTIGIGLVEFVFALFQNQANKIQFEARNASIMVENNVGTARILKIHKEIFIGALFEKNRFTLLIVNLKKQIFTYIDPKTEHSTDTAIFFDNFKQYILRHNKKYFQNKIPEDNWTIGHLHHQTEVDENNSGLMILNFAQQFLKTERTDRLFCAEEYRLHLQHLLLQKSKQMFKKCILCGDQLKASYVTCDSCGRGSHRKCMDNVDEDIRDDTINFFCLICKANSFETEE